MARQPRFVLPGHPQHVIIRGNNRDPIFYGIEDYQFYLDVLGKALEKHSCQLHAYVLMTNHVHLLLTPQTEHGIGKTIQMVGRHYVQHFNYAYDRTGTLWEGRYKATLIDTESYLLTCYRYIELNPVRAKGMVNHPSEYPWSSYCANALGHENKLVAAHDEYLKLGKTPSLRQSAYRALFKTQIPDHILGEIREATNKAWVLGSRYFKDRIEAQLSRPALPTKRGGDRRSANFKANGFNRV